MAPHVRTVPTASKATAVQIVWSSKKGARDVEHIGSAHSEAEVALLKASAYQRIAGAGQDQLPLEVEDSLGVETTRRQKPAASGIKVASMRMGPLIEALTATYRGLGFEEPPRGMRCSTSKFWPGWSSPHPSTTLCG